MVRCACNVVIVPVILMKLEGVEALAFGWSSARLFVRSNPSARNCKFHRSVTWNDRNSLRPAAHFQLKGRTGCRRDVGESLALLAHGDGLAHRPDLELNVHAAFEAAVAFGTLCRSTSQEKD